MQDFDNEMFGFRIKILMSQFYNPKRTRNLFDPAAQEPYKLSRSKLELFMNCPRCFYLDRRLGIGWPPSFPFSLNAAVDKLLKKEFDLHRAKGTPHPLMKAYGLDAVPFPTEKMNEWRDALRGGIEVFHEPANLLLGGAIDDLWVNPKGELLIVDYKATSKNGEVNLDAEWQDSYKRQMEIYQWLFRGNGFKVSSTGYFVYCNGNTDKKAFDAKLEFDITILPYEGNDDWVEGKLEEAKKCLMSDSVLPFSENCDFCSYTQAVSEIR